MLSWILQGERGERDLLGREGMGMIGNELGERLGEEEEGLIILLCNTLKAINGVVKIVILISKKDELMRDKEPKHRDKKSKPRSDAMDLVIEDKQIL